MSLRVGIDVGGTFTDVTVLDEADGEIKEVWKVPSNPQNQIAVFKQILDDLHGRLGDAAIISNLGLGLTLRCCCI